MVNLIDRSVLEIVHVHLPPHTSLFLNFRFPSCAFLSRAHSLSFLWFFFTRSMRKCITLSNGISDGPRGSHLRFHNSEWLEGDDHALRGSSCLDWVIMCPCRRVNATPINTLSLLSLSLKNCIIYKYSFVKLNIMEISFMTEQ